MLLALISGMVTGFSFIVTKASFLCFFSLICLFYLIKNKELNFKTGFIYGLSLNLFSMLFVLSMHPLDFLGIGELFSAFIVFAAYIFIAFFQGILWGIIFYIFGKFIKIIWLFPLFYAICEFIITLGELGFSFSCLYLPFYENTLYIQLASVLGGFGITLLTVTINFFIFLALNERKRSFALIAVLLFSLNTGYGYLRINYLYNDIPLKENITLIQGNISSNEKWQNAKIYEILRVYKELTLKAKEKEGTSFFIWPETVVPVAIDKNHNIYTEICDFAKENKLNILTGAFIKENNLTYNSIVFFDKEGTRLQKRYDKRHLIPFAEYNPFSLRNIEKGKKASVIHTKAGDIGTLICIDSAYPYLLFKTLKETPDFLIVASNDSWFENSYGVYNHYAHSVFRAIESGKYLLRCANTGISAIITPTGEVKGKILPKERGYITYEK